jgi:hypothetical protein
LPSTTWCGQARAVVDAMWSLSQFRYGPGIPGRQVYVTDDNGEQNLVDKDEAIREAHAKGCHLVAEWPTGPSDGPAVCAVARLALPLQWEQGPELAGSAVDEQLWFLAPCGGRDFFVGNGHTFTGRIAAWCPDIGRHYNVSVAEVQQMSEAARFWVQGFLHGTEPDPPRDPDGETSPEDLTAWLAATTRFRRTGSWFGRWRTCQSCGRVLLPDTAAQECESHNAVSSAAGQGILTSGADSLGGERGDDSAPMSVSASASQGSIRGREEVAVQVLVDLPGQVVAAGGASVVGIHGPSPL